MSEQKIIPSILLALLTQISMAAESESIRLIVKYNDKHSMSFLKKSINQSLDSPLQKVHPIANGAYVLEVKRSKESLKTILKKLHKDREIAYAVEDKKGFFKPFPALTNDTFITLSHAMQWDEFTRPGGIMLESAPGLNDGAWRYTQGNLHPVVVAVLDTGIEANSSIMDNLIKDEKGTIWGWNFAGNDRNLTDETLSYHGTHVSGTIAATGATMQGIGQNLSILTLKIPDASGMFYESQVIDAIYWAVGQEVSAIPTNPYPAKVLNMSFGVDEYPGKEIDYCDDLLQEAIDFARAKGAVIVVAAGNDNKDGFNAPAACKNVLRIASTGPKGYRAYYSNYGEGVNFAAPGGDLHYGLVGGILSTVKPGAGYEQSGFAFYQGTSMATPHVAGVAGLIHAFKDNASAEYVEKILYTTTHDFGEINDANYSCKGKKSCGHGILDAEQAVLAVLANYDAIFSAPKNPLIKANQQWSLKSKNATLGYQEPKLIQTATGDIIADYGRMMYQLNRDKYKHCQLIGYDGVGCYY